jgi:hypothetical protein
MCPFYNETFVTYEKYRLYTNYDKIVFSPRMVVVQLFSTGTLRVVKRGQEDKFLKFTSFFCKKKCWWIGGANPVVSFPPSIILPQTRLAKYCNKKCD